MRGTLRLSAKQIRAMAGLSSALGGAELRIEPHENEILHWFWVSPESWGESWFLLDDGCIQGVVTRDPAPTRDEGGE